MTENLQNNSAVSNLIHLVTPWFGRPSGGAEIYCRELAGALAAAGNTVEVLTTCCPDPFTDWSKTELPTGVEQANGYTIRRFPPNPRDAQLYVNLERKLQSGSLLTPMEQRNWIRNSINSDELCQYIGNHRPDGPFVFLPYLYGTTWHGVKVAGDQAWIIPCLHNETPAYFSIFDETFHTARGYGFLSRAEMQFARVRFGLDKNRCHLIYGGLPQPSDNSTHDFRRQHKIHRPYLLYVGRLVPGKGADLLIDFYQRELNSNPDAPDLVIIGEGDQHQPGEKVHLLGRRPADEVHQALAGCLALCQPSWYESFSFVLLEAWRLGRPAIVNAFCDVTREHCQTSGGGLWFADSREFSACVLWLQNHPDRAAAIGRAGQHYVAENFTWDKTVPALLTMLHT